MAPTRVSHSSEFHQSDSAEVVMPMSRRLISLAAKILFGGALVALSFWGTLQIMDRSPWQPIRSNKVLVFGDASASMQTLAPEIKFQFAGNGYAEIEGTKGLRCLTFSCRFALMVTFFPTNAN